MALPQWHALHFNAIAKEIRQLFPVDGNLDDYDRRERTVMRATLTTLAINFASRFKEANPAFDPIRFLDACSPNPDLYPLSELWED